MLWYVYNYVNIYIDMNVSATFEEVKGMVSECKGAEYSVDITRKPHMDVSGNHAMHTHICPYCIYYFLIYSMFMLC